MTSSSSASKKYFLSTAAASKAQHRSELLNFKKSDEGEHKEPHHSRSETKNFEGDLTR